MTSNRVLLISLIFTIIASHLSSFQLKQDAEFFFFETRTRNPFDLTNQGTKNSFHNQYTTDKMVESVSYQDQITAEISSENCFKNQENLQPRVQEMLQP